MKTRDFVFTIVGFLICWLFTLPLQKAYHEAQSIAERDTIYDTIAVVQPIAKDSLVVRYKTIAVRIEKSEEIEPKFTQNADSCETGEQNPEDFVQFVQIPITSKHYADTLYDAWVSGFEPSLDSIKIYPRTITERITAPAPPRRRWHIGPSIGISATPHGLQPTVGLTLTYSLMSF